MRTLSILLIALGVFVVTATATAEPGIRDQENHDASKVKIGFILPMSGKRASIGEDTVLGIKLALEHLKKKGPLRIEPIFEDSQAEAAKGVAAYKKLQAHEVNIIVTQNSNVSLAIQPLANHDNLLQLAITTTSHKYSTPRDLSFRINGSTMDEAKAMVDFLVEQSKGKENRLAVLTMEDDYPLSLYKNVIQQLELNGITPTVEKTFLPDESDFRSLIANFKHNEASMLLLLAYPVQAGQIVKQQRELGFSPGLIITSVPVNNQEFFDVAGKAAEGVFVTYIKSNSSHPAAQAFLEAFGKKVNFFSANGYDAVLILGQALEQCLWNPDPKCLSEELYQMSISDGLSGRMVFDKVYGDMADDYEVLRAQGGAFRHF